MGNGRVDFDNVWGLPGSEAVKTGTGLGIPQLHIAIVGCRKEAFAVRRKGNISDSLGVTGVCTKEGALVVDIPNLKVLVGEKIQDTAVDNIP